MLWASLDADVTQKMRDRLETFSDLLMETALKVLRENLVCNRSVLPPFQLPQISRQLVFGLKEFLQHGSDEQVQALGDKLGLQGLGHRSLLAVSRAWMRTLCGGSSADPAEPVEPALLARMHDFLTLLSDGLSAHEMQALLRERDEFQASLARVMREREDALRLANLELSTPIIPLYDGLLAVPLIGAIDRERADTITERLLTEVVHQRARMIIIDITGVPAMDAEVAMALVRTARAVSLLGSRTVLVGIRAEMAAVLTRLEIPLDGLVTRSTMQSGIAWALHALGLMEMLPSPTGKPTLPSQVQTTAAAEKSIPKGKSTSKENR